MSPDGPTPRLDGLSILVVESDVDNREMIVTALRSKGAVVRAAKDGADAWKLAGAAAPDLLLVEIVLPGEDGVELMRRLRDVPRLSKVPAIALTTQDGVNDRIRILRAGFQTHIIKPVVFEELVLAIVRLAEACMRAT